MYLKGKRIKPNYICETYLFSQREVVEALGLKVPQSHIVRVYCDGDNKVRIEVFK